jgi:YidC/Oxa1 family membrane protein insertase
MDKRSILGLVIIGAILFIFSYFNAEKAAKDIAAQPTETTSTQEGTESKSETVEPTALASNTLIPVLDADGNQVYDTLQNALLYRDTLAKKDTLIALSDETAVITPMETIEDVKEETVTIANELLQLDISNKGGRISNVYLKEFKSYDAYVNEKNEMLQLFDEQSNYGVEFFEGDQKKNTKDYAFRIVDQNDTEVTVEMMNPTGKIVGYKYALTPNSYDVNYSIYFKGFSDRDVKDIALATDLKLLSSEKHLPSEQMVSTVFYKYKDDSYDYLSERSDDEEELEETTEWVAYKQSYFSAIIMSDAGFPASNSSIEIKVFPEETADSTYIKNYRSHLNLGITNIDNTVDLTWYFGPNDYELLKEAHGNGTEDIVNLGWGLFRWINVYFMQPIFTSFIEWGIGAGIAIFLLTLIVKLVLSPVNYKMYKSSAMMKVLRPEIEQITKKFPKKEDAMKKQQATMALYRETGVSPMAGCVPMLIQMPILFAIFRLFPAEIAMRQQNFLWAEDLSTYDSILNLGFNIPFYGDHVSLFTLLMAGTTLLYTHYNSANMQQPTMEGMPNMKYIMYFFPFMMIFFFNSYSSGLSYYYFISTLFTIGIMFAIKRFMLDEEKIHAKVAANRESPKKKGKSKFAQRLEEAQKLQQQRAKGKK